jgi:hypothetical protein
MQTSMQKLASQHAAKINDMISSFESQKDNTQIQALGGQLRSYLLENGLAKKEHIHHSQVGVHPDNRESEMLIPIATHSLMVMIANKGYNLHETELALCCGIPPNETGQEWVRKNVELASQSDGLLAQYEPELLTHVTGAGSHSTAVLRLIDACGRMQIAACPGDEYKDLSVEGFLSKQRILEKCPTFAAPLAKGMRYTHIRWEIAELCPDLMRLLSEADNAKHAVKHLESVIQSMFNMHRRGVEMNANTDDAWASIVKTAARAQSEEMKLLVADRVQFVRVHSGGAAKPFLIELNEFSKTLRVQRELPGAFLKEAAKHTMLSTPLTIVGMAKAVMWAPEMYVMSGTVKLFNACDFAAMKTTRKELVSKCHQLQLEFRDMGLKLGLTSDAAWHKVLGNTDARLYMFVHNKAVGPNRQTFKSTFQIVQHGYAELKEAMGEEHADKFAIVPCPWVSIALAGAEEKKASGKHIHEANIRGIIDEDVLRKNLGFSENKTIVQTMHKPSQENPQKYTILSFLPAAVKVKDLTDDTVKEMPFASFEDFVLDETHVQDRSI